MDTSIYKYLQGLKTNFRRKSLGELLNEEKPHVIINGKRHRIKKRELDLLKELNASENLKIPIVLEIDASYESGTVKIEGREEVKVVSKILDKEINIFEEEDIIYIYKPELRILRKKLPTATAYIFKISL